jgi:hypothetical protein
LSEGDPSFGVFEWSAVEDCELDDLEGWRQSNPSLGYLITRQAIHTAMITDPPELFRNEVLCQEVTTTNRAIDSVAWKASLDPRGTLDGVRDGVVLCIDVSPDEQHISLVAAAELPSGRFRVEVVSTWRSTEEARSGIRECLDIIQPKAVAWFPKSAGAVFGSMLRKKSEAKEFELINIRGEKVSEACMSFADMVKAHRIMHPGDPMLTAHTERAEKLMSSDGTWVYARGGPGHITGVYASAGAVYGVTSLPEKKPLPKPMAV